MSDTAKQLDDLQTRLTEANRTIQRLMTAAAGLVADKGEMESIQRRVAWKLGAADRLLTPGMKAGVGEAKQLLAEAQALLDGSPSLARR